MKSIAGIQDLPFGLGGFAPTNLLTVPRAGLQKRSQTRSRGGDTYWHEEYQLWAEDFLVGDPQAQHTWGTHFFLDEAATQPAGDDIWQSNWAVSPTVDDQELRITGGQWTGLLTNTHVEVYNDGRGSEVADGFIPRAGNWEYTMSWTSGGSATVDAKYTDLQGSWRRYLLKPDYDEGQDITITTSVGVKAVMAFDPDYAGTGQITGPSAILPATMEWNSEGIGIITWADASTTEFSIWDN